MLKFLSGDTYSSPGFWPAAGQSGSSTGMHSHLDKRVTVRISGGGRAPRPAGGKGLAPRPGRRARRVGRGPVAALPIVVQAPAIGGTRGGDPAVVEGAGPHRHEARPAGNGGAGGVRAGLL